mgnify:CR=1 FL=1
MVIGACGYGATGSSIITDFMREFDDTQVFDDFEFTFCYRVDGIEDLEYHVMKDFSKSISGDAAVKRFLYAANYIKTPLIHKPCDAKTYMEIVHKYINSIVQVRFEGMESIDFCSGNVWRNILALGMKKKILPNTIEKWLGKPSYVWPNRDLFVCVQPDNFYEASKQFIRDILNVMGADQNKTIVLDQPFSGNNPLKSMKYFDNPKAIIIDRDPRDLYLESKMRFLAECRFLPRDDIKKFCEYYKRIHTGRPTESTDNILLLQFEDLMYHYDREINRIIKFAGLGKHVRKQAYFNPARSVNNTQIIRKYPQEQENIAYIEKELKDYLYPFEKYQDVDTSGEAFLGSAKYLNINNK